jgi:hypothetical protein
MKDEGVESNDCYVLCFGRIGKRWRYEAIPGFGDPKGRTYGHLMVISKGRSDVVNIVLKDASYDGVAHAYAWRPWVHLGISE